jgi:hypothetical protein
MIDSDSQLWRVIELNRVNGKTKKRSPETRYICKQSDYNRVATKRARLWGAAKGAWIGAGMAIARKQSGLDRINIGKNFLGWAHRHANKGRGRQSGRNDNTTVILTNKTTGAAKRQGLSPSAAQTALSIARKAVFAYYSKRLRTMKIKGRGGR